MDSGGAMMSNFPGEFFCSRASFSQASSIADAAFDRKVMVAPRAPVSSTSVFEQRFDKVTRLGFVAARLFQRIIPGRQVVPA